MNVLALDAATLTGWATQIGDARASGVWNLAGGPGDRVGVRFVALRDRLYDLCERIKFDLIAFEELALADKSLDSRIIRGGLRGVIDMVATEFKTPIRPVAITALKSFATGSGNASKSQMIQAARCRLGARPIDDNEADALWVLQYAITLRTEETAAVKRQRTAPKLRQVKLF